MRHRPETDRHGACAPARRRTTAAALVLAAGLVTALPASAEPDPAPEVGATSPAPAVPGPTAETEPASSEDLTTEPTEEPTGEPTEEPTEEPTDTPTPPQPEPFEPMAMGERSPRIRVLESRLHQLGHHTEIITSLFEQETRRGVRAFKRAQGLGGRPGVVNKTTWDRLVALTRTPTRDELNNVYTPGPPLLKRGTRSRKVRDLEARLTQVKHFKGRVGARYDSRRTVRAVRSFQKSVKIPVTGAVDARTRDRLRGATRKPTRAELRNWQFDLDARCLTGRVMCIDKTTRSLKWVVGGTVKMRLDARFGDPYYPTREGSFKVFWKSRDHVSSIYHTPMPFAMFFSGGQAVHYSPDFKKNGYDGHSHGCVNIRNRRAIKKLFGWVKVGERVVVHRS